MASREVRKLVYGRLPLWGSIQRDGPLASVHTGSGGAFGPRMAVPHWCLDLSRAFAALNDAGPQLRGYRFSIAGRSHLNDMQRVIWAYYVEGADTPLDLRSANATVFEHQRQYELKRAQKSRDWRVDDEIAKRLHLSGRTARRLRTDAVWLMATLVNWEDEVDALAS